MRVQFSKLAALGVVFLARAFATPCVTDTLANYISLGGTGCTINGELVDNFTFAVNSSIGSPTLLTTSQITVTPSFTTGRYQVEFSNSSNGFFVSGGQSVSYEFNFTFDPVVVGAEDDMFANTPVFPGTATATTALCEGAVFSPSCGGTLGSLTVFNDGHPADAIPTAITTFSPVLIVDTKSNLTLAANGASSEITGFAVSVFTPEPASFLPAALGLLLIWHRRKPAL